MRESREVPLPIAEAQSVPDAEILKKIDYAFSVAIAWSNPPESIQQQTFFNKDSKWPKSTSGGIFPDAFYRRIYLRKSSTNTLLSQLIDQGVIGSSVVDGAPGGQKRRYVFPYSIVGGIALAIISREAGAVPAGNGKESSSGRVDRLVSDAYRILPEDHMLRHFIHTPQGEPKIPHVFTSRATDGGSMRESLPVPDDRFPTVTEPDLRRNLYLFAETIKHMRGEFKISTFPMEEKLFQWFAPSQMGIRRLLRYVAERNVIEFQRGLSHKSVTTGSSGALVITKENLEAFNALYWEVMRDHPDWRTSEMRELPLHEIVSSLQQKLGQDQLVERLHAPHGKTLSRETVFEVKEM